MGRLRQLGDLEGLIQVLHHVSDALLDSQRALRPGSMSRRRTAAVARLRTPCRKNSQGGTMSLDVCRAVTFHGEPPIRIKSFKSILPMSWRCFRMHISIIIIDLFATKTISFLGDCPELNQGKPKKDFRIQVHQAGKRIIHAISNILHSAAVAALKYCGPVHVS